ncbi:hypothetical protein PBI_SCTP2_19 [Salicola phage SCTP-2]|nr:hypothetical protein PBI_SCTP2_19 [Salicola phage SCTP-2]
MFEALNLSHLLGQDPITFIRDQIQNNQMLVAFVATMAIGSILFFLRKIPSLLSKLFLSNFTVVMTVSNSDLNYNDIMNYFTANGFISSKVRRVEAIEYCQKNEDSNSFKQSMTNNIDLGLGPGYHIIFYKRKPFLIHHHISQESKMKDKPKTLTIRTFGRNNTVLKNFLHDVTNYVFNRDSEYIRAEIVDSFRSFETQSPKRYRHTLILDKETEDDIFHDIGWFTTNRNWYMKRGIAYKRGYLFYGPPGTGKTSLVKTISTYLETNIKIINLNSVMDDNQLLAMFASIDRGSIVLLEDIDAINLDINERNKSVSNQSNIKKVKNDSKTPNESENEQNEQEEHRGGGGVTLSGVLNALDGVTNSDSVITIMTTNYPEKIDTAMLRPGRVDKKVYIGYPNFDSCKRFFEMFYDDIQDEEIKDNFAQACVNNQLSPADIQEVCIENIGNPEKAIDNIKNNSHQKSLHSVYYTKNNNTIS